MSHLGEIEADMASVREQLLRQFSIPTRMSESEEDVAAAVYAMLWSMEDLVVDGWMLGSRVSRSGASCR
jgi:hypothetical protein